MTVPDPRQDPELKITLRCGSVYYFQHYALKSPEPHYFIVVNATPLHDSALLLVVSSSKIEKVKARRYNLPLETLVLVTHQEYPEFPGQESVIDCNTIIECPHSVLLEKRWENKLGKLNDLPRPILEKVINGIHISPMHKPAVKILIPPINLPNKKDR